MYFETYFVIAEDDVIFIVDISQADVDLVLAVDVKVVEEPEVDVVRTAFEEDAYFYVVFAQIWTFERFGYFVCSVGVVVFAPCCVP